MAMWLRRVLGVGLGGRLGLVVGRLLDCFSVFDGVLCLFLD